MRLIKPLKLRGYKLTQCYTKPRLNLYGIW
ncbi:hypothetical protein cd3_098 [Carnobacterium phage cd3]|uniref:Uncharacterized protein n=1 Tax=Carnobacterium phage cd2 TaxID=2849244 RepID=A0AAE7SQ48_9CAUD|nr:hypothetical protein PQD68_gp098 [Carnobacterium phage cd2]QXP45114.1 hypothetical protein cd2_098 [Carnobacterium phage cd2]QXP45330.1 hypothetical protein cd3_098 [Carnobacterium phage cd3]